MSGSRQRPLLVLGVVAAAAAVLLASVHQWTAAPIAEQAERRAHATLTQLLPDDSYDNDPIRDRFPAWIAGLEAPSTIHRARQDGEPAALLADVTTSEGYSGPIRLLIALRPNGDVLGVRVLEHRETPGLGDRIERDRSDWITRFDDRALGDPPVDDWRPDRRGGAFDTLSSATITSAAVIDAVRRVLAWQHDNRERIFDIPSVTE